MIVMLTTDGRDYGIAGLSLIIVGGVVRAFMRRAKGEPGRLRALEIKMETTKEGVIRADARVVDLEKLFEERTASMDNKMDIVLQETQDARAEVKEMRDMIMREFRTWGERIKGAEKDIEHLGKAISDIKDDMKRHRQGRG